MKHESPITIHVGDYLLLITQDYGDYKHAEVITKRGSVHLERLLKSHFKEVGKITTESHVVTGEPNYAKILGAAHLINQDDGNKTMVFPSMKDLADACDDCLAVHDSCDFHLEVFS